MKNKKVLSLLHLLMVGGVLTSCGKNQVLDYSYAQSKRALFELKEDFKSSGSNVYINENGQVIKLNDPDDPEVNQLQELVISQKAAVLFYSSAKSNPKPASPETLQLSVSPLPKKAATGTIVWASSNSGVASVNQSGLVTAVSQGETVITATSANGKTAKCTVVVNDTNILPSKVSTAATNILTAQASSEFEAVNTVALEEVYSSTSQVDGVVKSRSVASQKMWASVDKSYFRITSNDEEIKTNGGSVVPSSTAYIFYTTAQYHSYLFCNSDGKANYMFLNQSYLRDEGKSQFQALGEVLQSFFVAGSSIMTRQFTNVIGNKELTSGYSGAIYKGTLGADSGSIAYTTQSVQQGKASASIAESLDIPVGVYVTITDSERYLFKDNLLLSESITEVIEYEYGGESHVEEIKIEYYYQGRNVELLWPETKNYTKVDSIFDL